MDTNWLSPAGLADELGVPVASVYEWNSAGTGPRYHRVGRHVRYARTDVDAWMRSRLVEPRAATG